MEFDTSKLATKKENDAKDIFYEHIVPLAEESFIHDGKLASMVFLFLDDPEKDKIAIAPMPADMFMESSDKKELLATLLHEMADKLEIVAIGMFAEAWATKVDTETNEISEKQEICFFSFESENLIYMKRNQVFRSPEDNKISFEYGQVNIDQEVSGRFVGFLKDLKKIKQN